MAMPASERMDRWRSLIARALSAKLIAMLVATHGGHIFGPARISQYSVASQHLETATLTRRSAQSEYHAPQHLAMTCCATIARPLRDHQDHG